jgi:hypothetical protein
MPAYYVETMQPDGTKAEAGESFDTFDAAIDWLDKRKQDDPNRILRIRGPLTPEQIQRLSSHGSIEQI